MAAQRKTERAARGEWGRGESCDGWRDIREEDRSPTTHLLLHHRGVVTHGHGHLLHLHALPTRRQLGTSAGPVCVLWLDVLQVLV